MCQHADALLVREEVENKLKRGEKETKIEIDRQRENSFFFGINGGTRIHHTYNKKKEKKEKGHISCRRRGRRKTEKLS